VIVLSGSSTHSFKERNKEMTDALVVTRSVRLSVYNFFNEQHYSHEKTEQIVKTLTELSGLNVHRGGLSGKKIYAYFNNADDADMAGYIIKRIIYCKIRISRGKFDVTNLAINSKSEINRKISRISVL
jgi:hypothetical protein